MKQAPFFLVLIFLTFATGTYAGENFFFKEVVLQNDSIDHGLTSMEWKKFKKFEEVLQASGLTEDEKKEQLTGYARDSLRILEVKLIAIKVLDEKNLLNRDVADNPSYYLTLLEELKESKIPPAEYLFLEEKLAYSNQGMLTEKLKWSRWINIGLITLVIFLTYAFLRQRKKRKRPILSELSKQETLVRNLILQGKSNKEIATELFISLSTVKSHITNIYSKLNVTNRQQLLEISTGTST